MSKLSQLSDPFERLGQGIDFEMFRKFLESRLSKLVKGEGSRSPYDYVLMFKILILQRYYNLSDDQVEYQINDRLSFMRFLDLTTSDDIPDSKTVWNFQEQITDWGLVEDLFGLFLKKLEDLNLIVNEGKIVDASFIEVPRQRNSREENREIKNGHKPDSFQDNPHKQRQKETDIRWTKKNNVSFFGYKDHVKQDAKSKFITKYHVTDARVHDSGATQTLPDKEKDKGEDLYADSAYSGVSQEKIISDNAMTNQVCKKGIRNHPLTEEQRANNREKSKIRSRVEHIFGFMEMSMNGMYIQCIGIKRATAIIGLMNLTYNMFGKIQLESL